MESSTKKNLGAGCVSLFALAFAGPGIFLILWTIQTLWYWNAIQSWVETPCDILEAELKESTDGDGTTYQAYARYQYQWAGQKYISEQVSIHSGQDNLGDYQRNKADELIRWQQHNEPFRCFVNPDNPNQAILYRDFRFEVFLLKTAIGLLFSGVGIGILIAAYLGYRQQSREEILKTKHPDQPWLWQEQWTDGIIHSNRWGSANFMILATIVWNGITWTLAGIIFVSGEKPPLWVYGLLIGFAIIGLSILIYAGYLFFAALKWRASTLELATMPGVIGGKISGVILAPSQLNIVEQFLVTLTCFQEKNRNSEDNSYDDPIWQTDCLLAKPLTDSTHENIAIPVSFSIPYDCYPTDEEKGYSWKIDLQATLPGINYYADFEVPVYKTAESSLTPPADDSLLSEYEIPITYEDALQRSAGQLLAQSHDQCQIVFPMARNLGIAIGVSIFNLVWIGMSLAILMSDVPLIFRIAFPASSLLLLWHLAYLWFEKIVLTFGQRGIEIQAGLFGAGKRNRYNPDNIKAIVVEPSGTRSGTTVYQQISLHPHQGKARVLITRIERLADAEILATKIRDLVGL